MPPPLIRLYTHKNRQILRATSYAFSSYMHVDIEQEAQGQHRSTEQQLP